MQRSPYMFDSMIVSRVQKYLETNVDKTYVDINVMADELQQKYKEYAKRKQSAFRASVNKAYSVVLQSYGLDQGSSDDETILSDESGGAYDNKLVNNSMNKQIVDLYTTPTKQTDDNELIDISSDDSENTNTSVNNKASNGTLKEAPPATIKNISNNERTLYVKKSNKHPSDTVLENERKKRKLEYPNLQSVKTYHKKKKSLGVLQKNTCTFKDIGGMDKTLEDVCKLILHIKHPEIYKSIGISPPRGFLLHGPPGCGKTLLANAIANELNVSLLKVAAPELVAGVSGESEERIRELFEKAIKMAPCVLFIDEIDAITPNRQNVQKEMERRIVAQLLSCLDDLNENESTVLLIGATNRPDSIDPALRRAGRFDREISVGIPDKQSRAHILKIITSKLKLSENFDYELLANNTPGFVGADLLSLTREAALIAINRLFKMLKESRVANVPENIENDKCLIDDSQDNANIQEIVVDDSTSKDITFESDDRIADTAVVVVDDDISTKISVQNIVSTEGLVEENVKTRPEQEVAPAREMSSLEELLEWLHDKSAFSEIHLQNLCITLSDFEEALKSIQPSAKREGFATVPDITWKEIGSLREIREDLQMAIVAPVRHAEQFDALGIKVPAGVLLCGPPGCGKTLLAKAIANEAGINFISVKGPELLNMYVGESERAVRVCFERARNSAPCVIFFDEFDALCPKRSDSREGGATMRVVNQMLTEMDGIEGRKGVFLLAASNRPDIIDPAVLRPGRLDKIIFVGLPTAVERVDILRAITKNGTSPRLAPDVNFDDIGKSEMCRGYTGADLAALIREASVMALKEYMMRAGELQEPIMVTFEHFKEASKKIRPSVSDKDQKHYAQLRKMYSSVLENTEVEEMEYS